MIKIAKSWSILISHWEQIYLTAIELTGNALKTVQHILTMKSVMIHLYICETDYFKNVHMHIEYWESLVGYKFWWGNLTNG